VQPKEVPTVQEFAPRFIAEHAVANRQKASTISAKQVILDRHLVPALGAVRLDAITSEHVQSLKGRLAHLQPKTVNNVLAVLGKMLKTAVEWNVIAELPCRVRLLKAPAQEQAFYDFGEFERLVEEARRRSPLLLAVVLLGGEAGLRSGEMQALEWQDVNLQRKLLCVQRAVWRGHESAPKGGRLRYVPMTSRLAAALQALPKLGGSARVLTKRGRPLTERMLGRMLHTVERRAGLEKVGVHILRHTFCSHLAMRGAAPAAIQALAGHQSLATTQGYMHLSPASGASAIALLEAGSGAPRGGDMLETA